MTATFIITVLAGNNTYTARCNGTVASSTAGEIQAASACARKIVSGAFDLKRVPDDRQFYSKWRVILRGDK